MPPMDQKQFMNCWNNTVITREYARMLFTFGDMTLPYYFVRKVPDVEGRVIVKKGDVLVNKPMLLLPYNPGMEFGEGFDSETLPFTSIYCFRGMNLRPYNIINKEEGPEQVENRSLNDMIDEFSRRLRDDDETGLISGINLDVSLMRYVLDLTIKSAAGNAMEFFEHVHRQGLGAIGPDERVTDEDIRRLFQRE